MNQFQAIIVHQSNGDQMKLKDEKARHALMGQLRDIESSEELFLDCVRRACLKLSRNAESDQRWLAKWVPILLQRAER